MRAGGGCQRFERPIRGCGRSEGRPRAPCSVAVMDFGLAIFPTQDSPDPGTLASLVEEHGFESLFFPEHTHIPVSRRTPYPPGGELPREYSHTYDPLVALSFAATATTTLKLATGLMLVAQRDP